MFPPFACYGSSSGDPEAMRRRHQQHKMRMLAYWRYGVERQLAAVNAAISTLEKQMQRDGAQLAE